MNNESLNLISWVKYTLALAYLFINNFLKEFICTIIFLIIILNICAHLDAHICSKHCVCDCVLLKNKIKLSKFKDQVGFIQWFVNRAASHLAYRRSSEELYKNEDFYRQKWAGTRTKCIISSFFGGWTGSIRWITILLLTRKFQTDWLRLHYSWEKLGLYLS